jgi:hypothetical protein
MNLVEIYTETVLLPQLRQLGLNRPQQLMVKQDVTDRLESIVYHWSDLPFRKTVLLLGLEEATYWEPREASLESRCLVVVSVRNSMITDLNADQAHTPALRRRKQWLRDERMRWLTGAAIEYFDRIALPGEAAAPRRDVFDAVRLTFPYAWKALATLANSPTAETRREMPLAERSPTEPFPAFGSSPRLSEVESGFAPGLSKDLARLLRQIAQGRRDVFFTPCFKTISRNP